MSGIRSSSILAILTLAALPAVAAAAAPKAPTVTSEVSVTLVEIPVEVGRGGEPVTGLTAADFEVTEGRRTLPIVAFDAIDLGSSEKPETPGSAAAATPLAARRHLLFLFDFAFSQPVRLREGVAAARELAARGLDPRDLVAVGIYLPKGELQLLLSFTADRAAASRTLEALASLLEGEAPAAGSKESDPLRLTGLGARALLSQVFRVDERNAAWEALESLGPAKNANLLREGFLQRNVLAHSGVIQEPEVEARRRDHVMALAEAVQGLAETLRPVSGRKYLALFSEGFSIEAAVPHGGSQALYGTGGSQMLAKLDKTVRELRRSGWIVDAVSLGGGRDLGSEGLFYFAQETGGEMVAGTSHLAEGLSGALKRSAHGYLLTVQPEDLPADGVYHPVEVRLRDPQRAKVYYRGGYYAPLPFSRQKDVQKLAEAATLVAGEDERDDLGVQVMAVPLRTGAESTPVAIVVEVPGAPLLASGAPRVGLEVYGYALDEQGNSSDFFAEAVDLDRAKLGGRLSRGGVRVIGKLELPSVRHRVRVLVRDRGNGRLSLLSVPVSLAPAAAPGANLEALFLPPADDPWVLVRPASAALDIHGRAVLPAAHGSLPAAGDAQVLLLGHGLAGQGAWVRDRILTSEGRPVTGGTFELLAITPGEAGEPDLVMGRLRAGSLPPGRYLLELRVGDDGVARAATARPFLIAGPTG